MTKTYFIDIDGVLLNHNGALTEQFQFADILPQTLDLLNKIEQAGGKIILTTGRKESMRSVTERMLASKSIFYDILVMGCNRGPRVLINDLKPNKGVRTAYAFTPPRNGLDANEIEKILNPCEERQWGHFSTLGYSDQYHVKEIVVEPGKQCSLQSHKNREETWLVISGSGSVTIGDKAFIVKPGSVCQIGYNEKHQVRNIGVIPLMFIEIQTGVSFEEDDITRYE